MKKLLKLLAERLRANEDMVLVSVVASSGATPRRGGARMLVGAEGPRVRHHRRRRGGVPKRADRSEVPRRTRLAPPRLRSHARRRGEPGHDLRRGGRGLLRSYPEATPGPSRSARTPRAASSWGRASGSSATYGDGALSLTDREEAPAWLAPRLGGEAGAHKGRGARRIRRAALLRREGVHLRRRPRGPGPGAGAQRSGLPLRRP